MAKSLNHLNIRSYFYGKSYVLRVNERGNEQTAKRVYCAHKIEDRKKICCFRLAVEDVFEEKQKKKYCALLVV